MPLTKEDLEVGGLYRGKGYSPARDNDRVIIYMDGIRVQYDSYAVANGRHYPMTTVEKFLKWAKKRIQTPKEETKK
jgi:hypothetical protein